MRQISVSQISNRCISLLALLLVSISAFAQDGDGKLLDVDINVDKNDWYENPWVWVGVAVFILLLVLISRGKK